MIVLLSRYSRKNNWISFPDGTSEALVYSSIVTKGRPIKGMSSLTSQPNKPPIQVSVQEKIAWVIFDLEGEKVNKLSADVMEAFASVLDELAARIDLEGAIIASQKEGVFFVGADVNEIEGVRDRDTAIRAARMGQDVFGKIQELPFPVVAAINGVCLGGGTELSLACHGRIGTDHPRFQMGLPEVNLGLYPAWGGTTRLPRVVGLQKGLELILTGRAVDARKAQKMGLIDKAVPYQQVNARAVEHVRKLRKTDWKKQKRRRSPGFLGWLLEGNFLGRKVVFRQARKTVMARSHGHYPAPLKALDVVRRAWKMPLRKALELEAEEAGDLIVSPISKSLIHLFFLSEKAKKDPGVENEIDRVKHIDQTGLLGAGTMGGGIAWLFSYRDVPVRLKDLNPEALGAGMKEAYRLLDKRRKRRRMTAWTRDKKMTLVSPTLDWSGFKRADVVIEAIVEDLEVKKRVLRELESEVAGDCLIGSNTSTLPITELQSVLEHPERMAGFHFFNPVERMPLIEVIRGQQTSDETVAALVSFAKRIGKTPVVVNDCPGFLVNRILGPYLNEASYLLLETGDLEGIDKALLDFGMPMGPLRLLDEVGIDVAQKASKVLTEAYGAPSAGVIDKLVDAKRLGKKSGLGLYRHHGNKAQPDFEVLSILGVDRRRSVKEAEAVERCVYPMVAEAARCLDEKVVRGPGELDLAMVMGTGFPPFRGGLLRYSDATGLSAIVDGLKYWQDKLGKRFEPPSALCERASSERGFYV